MKWQEIFRPILGTLAQPTRMFGVVEASRQPFWVHIIHYFLL
jgi:hypothetical protein